MSTILLILFCIPSMIGWMLVYLIWNFKNQKGIDDSNWFNAMRILWYFYKRPEWFAELYLHYYDEQGRLQWRKAYPWLDKDESDIAGV